MPDEPSVYYDHSYHWAAPIELRWATRAGSTSNTRWVFARCCGKVGTVGPDGVILNSSFEQGTKCSAEAPTELHPGKMVLYRTTKSQAKNCVPIAHWSCCGKAALKSWDAKWDNFDCIGDATPPALSPGCEVWDAATAAIGGRVAPSENNATMARVALPLSRRAGGGHSSGGGSSGLELVRVSFKRVALADVRPTQRWINPTTFTTPTGPRDIFSVLADLLSDQDSPDEGSTLPIPPELQEIQRGKIPWPRIRVARRPADADGAPLFCIDNRRLFMLNVLGFVGVDVEEIKWMGEFDDKLEQRDPPVAEIKLHWRISSPHEVAVFDARARVDAMLGARREEQHVQELLAAAKLVVQDLEEKLASIQRTAPAAARDFVQRPGAAGA
ncbi:hypothetical protein T484DRAFT_1948132 [Baffinella frigidus]|nr:hypothetical protein T484DRAFT_1948132 [Cryptophyta sp. CCMP2293]